jgi:hypothetical protein
MSFDIFFQPCRFGQVAVEQRNPFTGKATNVFPAESLTPDEMAAVRNVLARVNAPGGNQRDYYRVELNDGGSAEVYAANLEKGCMVALRGITSDALQFLFDILSAGNWSMLPAMEDSRAIALSSESFKNLPEGFPPTVLIQSPAELGILLKDGFEAWKAFRDRVVQSKCP